MTTTPLKPPPLVDPQLAEVDGLSGGAAVVLSYFTSFNQGQYQQVADLFAVKGSLYPPFESPIVGREQIAQYLIQEADGMTVRLSKAETTSLDDGQIQVDVRGKVTALVFQVHVAWQFIVTVDQQIESVRVDLLATLEELLRIRPN